MISNQGPVSRLKTSEPTQFIFTLRAPAAAWSEGGLLWKDGRCSLMVLHYLTVKTCQTKQSHGTDEDSPDAGGSVGVFGDVGRGFKLAGNTAKDLAQQSSGAFQ